MYCSHTTELVQMSWNLRKHSRDQKDNEIVEVSSIIRDKFGTSVDSSAKALPCTGRTFLTSIRSKFAPESRSIFGGRTTSKPKLTILLAQKD